MGVGRIIFCSIVGLISIVFGVYVTFTARCKGPIFSNANIWSSAEERKKMNIKAEYRLVTIIFGCLSAIFALLALNIITLWKWTYILMWLLIVFVVVYAVIDAIKTATSKCTK